MPALQLFIIYAREDQPALKELKAHLRPLEQRGDLTVWYDDEILPGQNWDEAIKAQLAIADIVLLFISSSFFNSDYIGKEELKKALERHQKGEATVVPVIVRPCLWEAHDEIAALQVLPKDGKPVSSWGEADEAWMDVGRGIMRIAKKRKASVEITTAMIQYLELLPKLILATIKGEVKQVKELSKTYVQNIRTLESHATDDESMTGGAFFILYSSYKSGEWFEKDIVKAIKYLFRSAEKGYESAQFKLGAIYEEGAESIEPNINESVKWYRLAADQDHKKAKKALKRLGYSK